MGLCLQRASGRRTLRCTLTAMIASKLYACHKIQPSDRLPESCHGPIRRCAARPLPLLPFRDLPDQSGRWRGSVPNLMVCARNASRRSLLPGVGPGPRSHALPAGQGCFHSSHSGRMLTFGPRVPWCVGGQAEVGGLPPARIRINREGTNSRALASSIAFQHLMPLLLQASKPVMTGPVTVDSTVNTF